MVNKPFKYTRLLIREDFLHDDLKVCSIAFRDGQALLNKIHDSPKIFKSVMLGIWGALIKSEFLSWKQKDVQRRSHNDYQEMARSQNSKQYTGDVRQVFTRVCFFASEALVEKYILWIFMKVPRFSFATSYSWDDRVKAHVVMCLYLQVYSISIKMMTL